MSGLPVLALLLTLGICVKAQPPSCDGACDARLRTAAGWVCGRWRLAEGAVKYASFRRVPYGKPPLGKRRFQELAPMEPWEGFLDASEDGPACPQKDLLYGELTQNLRGMSEDCIHLQLHVPYDALPSPDQQHDIWHNGAQSPGLPILVMVHGGGFHSGSGLTDVHGPEYLMTKNVIVITFNYRINVFGFLSLKNKLVPGNQALRDQLTLLRWVQTNARAFGGDPDNVTLMGQSAGATCAHLLSLSKASKGLFHRLILMSGTALPNYYSTSPNYAKLVADSYIAKLGITSTDPDKIHEQLTKIPIIRMMQAYTKVQHEFGIVSLLPVAEEEYANVTRVVDDHPLHLIAEGRGSEYPMLIGFTDKEEEFFRWICTNADILRRIKENPAILLTSRLAFELPQSVQPSLISKVAKKYSNGTLTLDEFLVHLADKFFKQPALQAAIWQTLVGAPVYLYQYSYRSERSLIKEALWTEYEGAAHVEDLTYVFRASSLMGDYVSFPPKNNDDRMKDWMTGLIANFMRCRNPTCSKEQSAWPPLDLRHLQYQSISAPMQYSMADVTPEQLELLHFYNELDPYHGHITDQLIYKFARI